MTNLTLARPAPARAGLALIVAPVLLLAAWVILWPLDGRDGPGLGWTAAHLSWIVAFALLAYGCVHVRLDTCGLTRPAGRRWSTSRPRSPWSGWSPARPRWWST